MRIWSTAAIYNASPADSAHNAIEDKPRQLASLSNHSGTIHAVRFSPNGKYIASGADDKIVCVYALGGTAAGGVGAAGNISYSFGSEDAASPVENWRTIRRLIGHDNDVQDLAWSYDSSILVSVGLDSKVVVWSGFTFEKLKTISNHQSLVKGITFDPANKYFATASDDRTIKVFRFTSPQPNATAYDSTSNFVLETTITAPFTNSPLSTYFRRCSWTPDGNHIVAANAVNGPVSCAAIVSRGSWDSDISFIGHEAPVEVCKCAPRLYALNPLNASSSGADIPTRTVIATASDDKALSLWITSNARPVIVMQDLSGKSFSDLAWSPDGMCLFATALDGSIIALKFAEEDIGYPMPLEENERCLQRFGANRRGAGIAESTGGLLLEEQSKAVEQRNVEGRMGALMGDHHASGHAPPVPSANDDNDVTMAGEAPPSNVQTNAEQEKEKEKKEREKEKEKEKDPGRTTPEPHTDQLERLKQRPTYTKEGKKRIQPLLISSAGATASSLPQPKLLSARRDQDYDRHDIPQSVLDLSKPFDRLPRGGLAALLLGNKRKYAQISDDEGENTIEKRVAVSSRNGTATPIVKNTPDGLRPVEPGDTATRESEHRTPDFIRPAVVNPSTTVSQLRLAVPKVRASIVKAIDANGNPTEGGPSSSTLSRPRAETVLEARNPPNGTSPVGRQYHDREPTRVSVTRGDQLLWQDFLTKPVLHVTGNKKFWAAACEDGAVYIWTPAGRRMVNTLVLEAQPVILECMHGWLLVITAIGLCYVWNISTMTAPHPPVSLAPVMDIAVHSLNPTGATSNAPAITNARISSQGRIIVCLSNGDGYSYSPMLYTWQRLSEGWWAVSSQYWNTTDASVGNLQAGTGIKSNDNQKNKTSGNGSGNNDDNTHKNKNDSINDSNRTNNTNNLNPAANEAIPSALVSAGIIPFLERNTTNEVLLRGRGYFLQRLIKSLLSREGFETFESSASIAHLENRIAAALSLGAKEEFRMYLNMYTKRLGAEGLKAKVEELLESLLGGIFQDNEDDDDDDDVDDDDYDDEDGAGEEARDDAATNVARSRRRTRRKDGEKEQDDPTTTGLLCGWSRRELLAEVILSLGMFLDPHSFCPFSLLVIYVLFFLHTPRELVTLTLQPNKQTGKYRNLQRITVPYAQLLGMLNENSNEDHNMTGDL